MQINKLDVSQLTAGMPTEITSATEALVAVCADPRDFADQRDFCTLRRDGSRWLRKHGFVKAGNAAKLHGWDCGQPVAVPVGKCLY